MVPQVGIEPKGPLDNNTIYCIFYKFIFIYNTIYCISRKMIHHYFANLFLKKYLFSQINPVACFCPVSGLFFLNLFHDFSL